MHFFPADYALLVAAAIGAALGLLGGFSGALAFFGGTAAAAFAGRFAWVASLGWFEAVWARVLATLGISLVAFGLFRKIIRKIVHGLLAQPGDAIFGILIGGMGGFALALGVAYLLVLTNLLPVQSNFLDYVRSLLGVA